MKIYKILENGYYGGYIDVDDNTIGIPYGTTRTEIIDIPENNFAKWTGSGWVVTSNPPPVEIITEELMIEEEIIPEEPIIEEGLLPLEE